MKRFTSLAIFIAIALSMSAQYYMHLWTDGITYSLPILNVDSVTFTDGPLSTPEIPDIPNNDFPEDGIIFDADIDLGNASLDSSNPSAYTVSKSGVTIDVAMGVIGTSGGEKHYRIYRGQTLVVTSTVGNITSVSFNCIVEGNEKYGPGCFSANTGSYAYSGAVGVWNGDADKVVFTAATNQVRATEIIVSIADNENEEPTTPEEPEVPIPNPEIADGVGVFSISSTRQVTFSPGNLQYHPKNDEWRFAEHQSISLDSANLNIAPDYDGWLDLFGWSGSTGPAYGVSSSLGYIYTGYFVDWGTNVIGNHAPNTWRTLSIYEWEYLLFNRENAASLHFGAIVNGKHGRVLLPDNWEEVKPLDFEAQYEYNIIQWNEIEALGAVFLPAGGDRTGDFQLMNYQNWGSYWTSTTESYDCNWAYDVSVSSYSIILNYSTHILRRTGESVRLVKDIVNPDISENGHEYVDLGLSVKWATCNIGANTPEEYGDYFAWGEVEPKEVYDWNTYKWCNGSYDNLTKYNNNSTSGITDKLTILNVNDDAAIVNWGGKWRMPTDAEFTELYEQCTWTWITENGTNGYKVIGPNGNSIFLPASGGIGVDNLNGEDSQAYYWSSSICSEFQSNAYSLCFSSNSVENHNNLFRCLGHSIRPVCGDVIIESDPNEDRPEVSCDDVLASGNCGDNVTWKVCSNRILYIEGEGKITSSPWRDANYDIDDIYIEEGITSICADAFRYMVFSSISLPLSLEYIGDLAFFNNNGNCKTIYIPKNVNYIGKGIVSASWYLEEIVVSPNNQHYKSIDGVCYDKQLSKAIICPANIQLEELDLPNTIVEIADWAFYSVKGKLESITASEGLLSIGEQAFNDCHVDTINLPSSLTSMVIDMAGGPFTSSEIKAIHVVPGGQYYRSEDGVLYTADYSTLVAYPGGRIESLYTVHPNTKRIEAWALSNNIGVEEVILPQGLEEIGYYAMGASTYKKVIIPATVTDISWWAFSISLTPGNFREGIWFESSTPCTIGSYGVFNDEQKIYVPCDAVDAYKNKWSRIENGMYIENIYPYPSCSDNSSEGIGVFSVGEGKTVTFSKGNLQYTQSTNTWSFASAQWEMIGTDNVIGGSVSSYPTDGDSKEGNALADKIDLFGWSTSATNFGVSTSIDDVDYSGSFVDWGTNKIGNDAPNTWRTLTFDEWYYLLNTRTNASSLKGVAQVNGVNGLIFLPDTWVCPEGITFKSGFHSSYSYSVDYYAAYQTFTAAEWSKLEAAGAVFLPAAGDRLGSNVKLVQYYGYYWSATERYSHYAYYLTFSPVGADMHYNGRYRGQSVRLVKDL